jgi:putative hydrolase of the HAD superfamily
MTESPANSRSGRGLRAAERANVRPARGADLAVNSWAVGFDLGDTLCEYAGVPLDWEREYSAALTVVARSCGLEATPERLLSGSEVLLRYNTRRTARPDEREFPDEHVFGELLAAWTAPRESLPAAVDAFFRHFRRSLRPFPESAGVLEALHRLGFSVGVLTDVPYGMPRNLVTADLSETGLAISDDMLVASTSVGHRKPHPAGFRVLAGRLGVSCERMTFVGNERKDVLGGNAAGCETVLLWRSSEEAPTWGQAYTVRSLREILRLPRLSRGGLSASEPTGT